MKQLLYKICVPAMALALVACDSFLDIKPKGELIPETASDYEKMLNDEQIVKGGETYPTYMTDDAFVPQESDGLAPGLNMLDQYINNLYTFQSEVFGDSEDDSQWETTYSRIYYFNVVIKRILDATEATMAEKQALRAEALMGRAFEYLTLVNAYARHYDAQTANTDPGVPLILDENIERSGLTRATVQEVYDQIKADLTEAAKYLPEKPKHNAFRASAPVGYGMLARMYLYMGDYAKALENANLSLQKNNALLDLKLYSVVGPNKAIGRLNVPDIYNNPENIYIRLAPYVFGLSRAICVSDELLALYDTNNDQRAKLYITNMPYGYPSKYNTWLPFLRANVAVSTPEMYLIAAECEARIGSKDKALELINKLRDNRIFNNTPLTASTNDEALNIVLEERRREFAMTGMMRFVDLKRLNKETRFAKTITHTVGTTTYTLEPNSPKYVLPIPAKVMRFNPGTMVQNER